MDYDGEVEVVAEVWEETENFFKNGLRGVVERCFVGMHR